MLSVQVSNPWECSPHLWLLGYPACLPCIHSHQCDAGSSWARGTSLDFLVHKVGLKTSFGGRSNVPLLLCRDGLSLVPLFSLQRDLEPLHRCGETGAREGWGLPWAEPCLRAEWR